MCSEGVREKRTTARPPSKIPGFVPRRRGLYTNPPMINPNHYCVIVTIIYTSSIYLFPYYYYRFLRVFFALPPQRSTTPMIRSVSSERDPAVCLFRRPTLVYTAIPRLTVRPGNGPKLRTYLMCLPGVIRNPPPRRVFVRFEYNNSVARTR